MRVKPQKNKSEKLIFLAPNSRRKSATFCIITKKKSCPVDNSFSFDVVFTTNYIAATSFTTSAATSATSGAPQVVATEAMRNVAATVRIA